MEFSVAKAIERLKPKVSYRSFPHFSSNPSVEVHMPGIGLIANNFCYFVPISGHLNPSAIKKKQEIDPEQRGGANDLFVEPQLNLSDDEKVLDENPKLEKLDPILLKSMKHPRLIETDSISFDEEPRVKKFKNSTNQNSKSERNEKIKHKFQFI